MTLMPLKGRHFDYAQQAFIIGLLSFKNCKIWEVCMFEITLSTSTIL